MREYETVFISHPARSDAQVAELSDRVTAVIARHGGKLFFAKSLGKRSLAYPIAKQAKGTYTCVDYAARGGAIAEIERMLKLDEAVLRFLTIIKRDEVDVEARSAEIIARGEDRSVETFPTGEISLGRESGLAEEKNDRLHQEEEEGEE